MAGPPPPGDPGTPDPLPPRTPARAGWLRASVREFFVIVAGVLVALAAQAWWEGRQERRLEVDYLRQVRLDALENLERLEHAISEDSIAAVAADSVILALTGHLEGVGSDRLLRWIGRVGKASDFQPVTGAHRALQETGHLRFVRDDSVRHALTTYASSLDRGTARLEQLRASVLAEIPAFARALPALQTIFVEGVPPGELDLAALRRDPAVSATVFTMQAAAENRLSGLRRMREETGALLATLAERAGAIADEGTTNADRGG